MPKNDMKTVKNGILGAFGGGFLEKFATEATRGLEEELF